MGQLICDAGCGQLGTKAISFIGSEVFEEGLIMAIRTIKMEDGRELPAQEVPYETVVEPRSEYKLEGGITLKLRTVAIKMLRVVDDDGNPAFTDDGEPWIIARNTRQLSVSQE